MPSRKQSLQTRVIREILRGKRDVANSGKTEKEPELPHITLNKLPSPLLFKAKNELAKRIQNTYRSKIKFGPSRKGSKMTTNEMRRQLSEIWSSPLNSPTFDIFINRTFNNTINKLELSEPEKIKFFINNLSRNILEHFYNNTWMLDNDEEDLNDINNPVYFRQIGGKKTKHKKTKHKKTYKH